MKNNVFDALQNWYCAQCDGDWEHEFGIKIDTLDNPGWTVEIDLQDTKLDGKTFNKVDRQTSEDDWVQCEVQDGKYIGAGGPRNLADIIDVFIIWASVEDKFFIPKRL
ncbi:MAG: immunity 53 family protein [Verrucomicrobia bacterium]|nr:immunity 53 family protein [Verrucomicrobiota bacterium]